MMVYDFHANNEALETFRMGVDWPYLLEQCGAYFPCMFKGARWYMLYDERMTTHHHASEDDENVEREQVTEQYPAIICNCGFEVTKEEAKVLARIAQNFAAIQRTLKEPSEEELNAPITKPDHLKPFPKYIRRDWVERYEQFAEWARQSNGFIVY
jgi:hypothetical protein